MSAQPSRVEILAAQARVALLERLRRPVPDWLAALAQDSDVAATTDKAAPGVAPENPARTRMGTEQRTTDGAAPRVLVFLPPELVSGQDVLDLQRFLRSFGRLEAADESGVFDEKTSRALQAFQAAYGIYADGILGRVTSQVIAYLERNNNSARNPPSADQMTLLGYILKNEQRGFVLLDIASYTAERLEGTLPEEDTFLRGLSAQLEGDVVRLTEHQTLLVDEANDEALVPVVNDMMPYLFLSLGFWSDHSRPPGYRVFYFGSSDGQVISTVGRPIAEAIDSAMRASGWSNASSVRPSSRSLFERIKAPVVRVELANLAHPEERERLSHGDAEIPGLSMAIARGLANFLSLGTDEKIDATSELDR